MVYLRYFKTKQEAISADDIVAPFSCFVEEGSISLVSSPKFAVGTRLRVRKKSNEELEVVPYNLTVTYFSVYGDVPAPKVVNYEYQMKEGDLPAITQSQYEFLGWYIGDDKIEPGYEVTDNITLVAKFNALTQYTITYVSEHDQSSVPAQKIVLSGYILTPADLSKVLSEVGWTFLGWNKSPGYVVTGNTIVTALWSVQVCTMNYEDPEAPGSAPLSKEVNYGYQLTADDLVAQPSIGALDFDGWYIDNVKAEVGDMVKSNPTVLMAVYNEVKFTVSYNNGGKGTRPLDKEVSRGYLLTEDDLEPLEETGYNFLGWYIGSTKIEAGYQINSDTELFAKWEAQ